MSLLPHENRDVVGVEYDVAHPRYKVGPLCSTPGCSRLADHAHHLWRRSFLAGDYGWVKLWDGSVVQNLTALCYRHHAFVTENRARISYDEGAFLWSDDQWRDIHLEPQPRVWRHEWREDMLSHPDSPEAKEHLQTPGHVEKCPTCKRALKKESAKTETARVRGKWSVTIPKDSIENGADVLDVLLEEAAKICGHDEDNAKTKYHTLAFALGMFVLHSESLLD